MRFRRDKSAKVICRLAYSGAIDREAKTDAEGRSSRCAVGSAEFPESGDPLRGISGVGVRVAGYHPAHHGLAQEAVPDEPFPVNTRQLGTAEYIPSPFAELLELSKRRGRLSFGASIWHPFGLSNVYCVVPSQVFNDVPEEVKNTVMRHVNHVQFAHVYFLLALQDACIALRWLILGPPLRDSGGIE
ncbi:MAG: hypothetical protein OXI87_16505 [Albidovulum sp.]|nr:hypothetical protein [Albidovulum sp.]